MAKRRGSRDNVFDIDKDEVIKAEFRRKMEIIISVPPLSTLEPDENKLNEVKSSPDDLAYDSGVNRKDQINTPVPALATTETNKNNRASVIYVSEDKETTNEVKGSPVNGDINAKEQISTSVPALAKPENNGNNRIPIIYVNDDDEVTTGVKSGHNGKILTSQRLSTGNFQGPNGLKDLEAQYQGQTTVLSNKRWAVLCAAFISVLLTTGLPFQLAIFYVEWLDEFNKSNSETALVQSVCIGTFLIGGCIGGLTVTKFGPVKCGMIGAALSVLGLAISFIAQSILHLTLALGAVTGFGFSLSFLSANFTVGQYFGGKQQLMALAIVAVGGGVGASVLPFVCVTFINQFGWRGALLLLAGIYTHLFAFPILYTKPRVRVQIPQTDSADLRSIFKNSSPQGETQIKTISSSSGTTTPRRVSFTTTEIRQLQEDEDDSEDRGAVHILINLLRKKVFVVFIIGIGMSLACINSFMIFFINYLQSIGLTTEEAVSFLTYMNISSTLFRLVPALAKQIPHFSVIAVPVISAGIESISFVLFTLTGASFAANVAVSILFGIGLGGIVSVLTLSIVKLVGSKSYAVGLGINMTMSGVMNTLAGPIGGFIRDASGDYELQLYCSSGVMLFAFVLFLVVMVMRYIENKDLPSRFDFELIIRRKSRRKSSLFAWRKKSVDITAL